MIYFTAHTFKCVCHCRRVMFRVLGMYNFETLLKIPKFDKRRAFNKAVGPGKKSKINKRRAYVYSGL